MYPFKLNSLSDNLFNDPRRLNWKFTSNLSFFLFNLTLINSPNTLKNTLK